MNLVATTVDRAREFVSDQTTTPVAYPKLHLMAALLDQEGGSVRHLLAQADVNVNQLRSGLGELLERLPHENALAMVLAHEVAHAVLGHRIIPNFTAEAEGVSQHQIVEELIKVVA